MGTGEDRKGADEAATALTVPLDAGRQACRDSIDSFLDAVGSFSEYELLATSRCHGWSRVDVVSHVLAGWQDMLGGFVSPVESEPSVDAATYRSAFAAEFATDDPIPGLMSQRRRTALYSRPSSVTGHLRDVAAALRRGVDSLHDQRCLWQGHVFAPGDFLAIWAVENVVHQLDLLADAPVPVSALALARQTLEALIRRPLPTTLSDQDATLIGTGRLPVPDDLSSLAAVLPALS